jgi:ribulose-5-phosphate 4-epimerase/fuculose-1-phosphate aldolase
LPLARAIKAQVARYIEQFDAAPKTIYLQNHGFIALGATTQEVLSITQMADKAAQILLGALAVGEPLYLSASAVERIYSRPDERVRQQALGLVQSS